MSLTPDPNPTIDRFNREWVEPGGAARNVNAAESALREGDTLKAIACALLALAHRTDEQT